MLDKCWDCLKQGTSDSHNWSCSSVWTETLFGSRQDSNTLLEISVHRAAQMKTCKGCHPSPQLLSFLRLCCHQNRHSWGHFSSHNGQVLNYWCRSLSPQMGKGSVAFFWETPALLLLKMPRIISTRKHTNRWWLKTSLRFADVTSDGKSDEVETYECVCNHVCRFISSLAVFACNLKSTYNLHYLGLYQEFRNNSRIHY